MKNLFIFSGVILSFLVFFLLHSCKKDKPAPPVITTASVTEITQTTATSGGDLIEISGASILSKGVCWNTSPDPTIDNARTIEGGILGAFVSKITQLTPNTMYYVRAYAISSDVTGYGNQVTFTTLQVAVPALTTTAVTSITETTAISGGIITNDGGIAVISRGVCWSITPNPTTANNMTMDEIFSPGTSGTGTGIFISNLTNLQPGTVYYVRSYAINSFGTAYGNELNFTTSAVIPTVATLTTTAISSITTTTANSGGNISSDGGASVTAYGVCWSTSPNPTIANSNTTDGTGIGSFTSSLTDLSANTTYYVRAYATNSEGTAYGNELDFTTSPVAAVVPTVTTTAATSVTTTTASSGGDISSDGGALVTERGVCWSTATDPTTSDNKTADGAGTGSFTSSITGLTANTTYYVRAYATNSAGTGYGNSLSFETDEESGLTVTDLDGNVYHSVTIGTQVWMVENLMTTKYSDNTSIPLVTDATDWGNLETPGYCWNNNDAGTYKATYGALYNWYTVNTGKLCPTGWHVPTDAEWTTLTTYLGGEDVAGGKLKEAGTTHWLNPNTGATNETGFTALPGGNRWFNGTFPGTGAGGYWWSSTQHSESFSWYRFMYYLLGYVDRDYDGKESGLSVRCLQGEGKVLPVVTTDAVTAITPTTATSGGDVTSDGGATVTACGICWSTTIRPTTDDSKTNDGSGTGSFTSSLTGLTANITYYVRAYATNSEGTAYGNETSFTTSAASVAIITTTAASSITQNSAISGGSITNDGGSAITVSGVCWSTSTNPVVTGNHTTDGSASGTFTSSITGLTANTTYYVRSYATNGIGTAYGDEKSFTTSTASVTMPALSTTTITGITQTTANSGGNITSDGGALVTARGVCWNTTSSPTITDSKTSNGTGTGNFTSTLTGLTANTNYYVRAYATNSAGTAYGNELIFTTGSLVPTLTTTAISSITTTTASSGGDITSDGGASVIARGVCWNTSASPTIALSTKTTDGSGTGSFTSSLTGLTPGATYYVRAYATNSAGTAYGNELSFSASAVIPTLSTTAIGSITATTAGSGGNISSDGGASVSVRGVCWNTSANPTIALSTKTTDGSGTGSFTSSLTGLTPNTTYYVRAYATNSVGTAYGDELNFTTSAAVPTLTTEAITSITSTTASSGGNISNDGGASVTERGVCWSTVANPTIALSTKTSDGSGTGGYSSSLTELTPGATYYVRAYATNSAGTAYGNELSFSASAVIPTLTTTAIGSITSTTASSGGNISSDGGASVSVRGVCWSTSTNPTTALSTKTTDGSGTGSFTSSLTGLTGNTTYYVRAYATNSVETAYGNEVTFITSPVIPTLTTTAIGSITSTTASSGGDITYDGGASVSVRGVCWSTTTDPTTSNSTTTDGSGTGSFTSSLTGLTPGATYYVRAYATNSAGTAYGNQLSFSASALIPTLTTTAIGSITSITASSGGNITNDGGASVSARGVCWNTSAGPTTALSTKTSDGTGTGSFTSSLTGLTPGATYYVRAYATNSAGTAYGDELSFTTFLCGNTFTVTHTTGDGVVPVNKTVTYGTVTTSLSGASKCWITQNLGADNQAGSATDNTEAAAGWYWQFNRKQGYKHDGTTRTPNTTWNTINESSQWTAANDPCTILLGTGWRIPTSTEWTNADATGGWTNDNATYSSVLKLHDAGYLDENSYLLSIGSVGVCWSSISTNNTTAVGLGFGNSYSQVNAVYNKTYGMSVRCIKD